MPSLLEADAVRVEFDETVAVADVSFSMSGGDLLGLIGPNGAGKTTLLRVLAGLQVPTAGAARVSGHDVLLETDEVRGSVGFAPDGPPAYEMLTIEQFLRFVAHCHGIRGSEATERIDFWLEQTWLSDKRDEKVGKLSKGMRQRVTIAQTLLPSPAVVLLDEPSNGLDPAGRIQLRRVIASLAAQGKAVIVSSHILADLEEYCTHIGIIERGRILRYAAVKDLHQHDADTVVYQVRFAADGDHAAVLGEVPGLANLAVKDGVAVFEAEANDAAAAALLRNLIDRGLPVCGFDRQRASLEDIYLKTGVRQVD